MTGSDFSISMSAVLSADKLINLPPTCFFGTCTYDFSQTASLSQGDESLAGHSTGYTMKEQQSTGRLGRSKSRPASSHWAWPVIQANLMRKLLVRRH